MVWCDRGVQMLLTTVGAFAAFSLMAIAIGTDYWLYSSAHICNGTNITADEAQGPPRRARGDLTHSGLWRICCLEGTGGAAPRRAGEGEATSRGDRLRARSCRAEPSRSRRSQSRSRSRSRAAGSDTAEEEDGVTVATGISEIAMGTGRRDAELCPGELCPGGRPCSAAPAGLRDPRGFRALGGSWRVRGFLGRI